MASGIFKIKSIVTFKEENFWKWIFLLGHFSEFQKAIKFFKTDNPEDFVFTSFLLNMEDAFPACFFIKIRIKFAVF